MEAKKLLIYYPDEIEGMNEYLINEDELDEWLNDGSLAGGEKIYEATLKYMVTNALKLKEVNDGS